MKRLALISVSDKRGLVPFARGLVALGFELVSTSGTYRLLRKGGLPVRELSKLTGFPEILGGRVKTLHPKVHGGILADRGRRSDLQTLKRLKISPIDLVVVNLYPFEAALRQGKGLSALVEEIDIGGVTLLRAAAKNFRSVGVVCRPEQYDGVLKDLRAGRGKLPEGVRQRLAVEAFQQTAAYDTMIQRGLAHRAGGKGS
ncbi:MAG: bifunctional phosphoribosylaminoimidazolecarboxamide formyltransferase/inosine monophosphate cyclohydrolase, partial [Candidatus Omnitrophica bacterium CG11_big_fil_rev_8_21_14_0_20_64_10]